MSSAAYISNESARTAGGYGSTYKSVQAWKSKKVVSAQAPHFAGQVKQAAKPAQQVALNTLTPHDQNAPGAAQQEIMHNLDKAAKGQVGTFDMQLETAHAYADPGQRVSDTASGGEEGFQFSDVIDVINPLQHLPVVGMVYRTLTGDKLHPMSQIIGSALYGGPVGAVTGTINAISQVQTGKDVSDHLLGFAGLNTGSSAPAVDVNNPESQLNRVARTVSRNDQLENLPGSTLSFVNLSEPNRAYQQVKVAEGRTAGNMLMKKQMAAYRQTNTQPIHAMDPAQIPETNLDNLPAREAMTTVQVSAMPERQNI
jgi:hypothetical protein